MVLVCEETVVLIRDALMQTPSWGKPVYISLVRWKVFLWQGVGAGLIFKAFFNPNRSGTP